MRKVAKSARDYSVRVEMESLEPRLLLSTYFIATNGSDSNAGSLASPLASLGKALSLVKAGDTVMIRGGTYNGNSNGWGSLTPTVSGTASAPITVQNYNGEKVTIDTGSPGMSGTFVYLKSSANYLTFSGLNITNFAVGFNLNQASHINLHDLTMSYMGSYGSTSTEGWGIVTFSGTHDISITGCDINHVAGPGIAMLSNTYNVTIADTVSHDNSDGLGADGDADGINGDYQNGYGPSNVTITNVRTWNNGEDGIDIKGDYVTLTNDASWNNGSTAFKMWSPENKQGHFVMDGCEGWTTGQAAGEYLVYVTRGPITTITNSTFWQTGTGARTFTYMNGASAVGTMGWTGSLTVSNTKFYYTGSAGWNTVLFDNNATFHGDNDYYYNVNAGSTFAFANGATYGNAAFGNGTFYTATGQEQHGHGTLTNIAPVVWTANVPETATSGTPISVSATGKDPDNGSLTYSWTFGDGTGAVSGATATHTYASGGTYTVTAIVSDGTNQGTLAQTIVVAGGSPPANSPPVANNDSYSVNQDAVLTTGNVLANDTDPNGDTLSVSAFTQAAHGTVVNNNNGTFKYTPTAGWYGADAFTYTVSDGKGGTDIGTVNITVNHVNHAPVANNDSVATVQDTPVTTANVLSNDTDSDGDTLSVSAFTQAAHGAVVNNNNGTFKYTPVTGWYGTDAFTYTVSDGHGGTAVGTVNVTVAQAAPPVNQPPVAKNDSAATVQDKDVVTPNVLANDSDPNGDTITISSFTQAGHGSVVSNNNGTFTYTPSAGWYGNDAFTYSISDGKGGTASASVTIAVAQASPLPNNPPVAVNDLATTNQNTSVVTPNVLANDSDPDGDSLSITSFTQAGHGNVVSNSIGTFTYTPTTGWYGSDAFNYTISDGKGGTATASVNITVKQVVPTGGRSFYISTSGNDANAGTLASPLATLAKFFALAQPGDTAFIRGGTYNGSTAGWSNLAPTVSGTADAPITVKNYNGEAVTINTNTTGSTRTFVTLKNSNAYLNFQGLKLVNFEMGFDLEGATASASPSFISFSGMNISYCGTFGSTSLAGYGIFMGSGTHDITITGSDIHHTSGSGIEMIGDVSNVTIQGTNTHDNSDGQGADGHTDGIRTDFEGTDHPSNITLNNDRAWNNSQDGFNMKGDQIAMTNLYAWSNSASDYQLWSPTDMQGRFTLNNIVGYAAGEYVIMGINAPDLTITNSSFMNSGSGASTFTYDGGQSWQGSLTLHNDRFYYNGTGSGWAAADIQTQNAVLNMDSDWYHNTANSNNAILMRNGSSVQAYSNASLDNGTFYSVFGEEQSGQGAQEDIAPFASGTTIPVTAVPSTTTKFAVTGKDPEGSTLTYKWSFGDGTALQSGSSVKHSFSKAGTYTVTLTISDGTKQTVITKTILVAPLS